MSEVRDKVSLSGGLCPIEVDEHSLSSLSSQETNEPKFKSTSRQSMSSLDPKSKEISKGRQLTSSTQVESPFNQWLEKTTITTQPRTQSLQPASTSLTRNNQRFTGKQATHAPLYTKNSVEMKRSLQLGPERLRHIGSGNRSLANLTTAANALCHSMVCNPSVVSALGSLRSTISSDMHSRLSESDEPNANSRTGLHATVPDIYDLVLDQGKVISLSKSRSNESMSLTDRNPPFDKVVQYSESFRSKESNTSTLSRQAPKYLKDKYSIPLEERTVNESNERPSYLSAIHQSSGRNNKISHPVEPMSVESQNDTDHLRTNASAGLLNDSMEKSFLGDDGTEDPTEDDTNFYTNDYLARRHDNQSSVIESLSVWYGTSTVPIESPRLREVSGPYGLLIRQIRDGRLAKWESLEALNIQNRPLLDDEEIVCELDHIRETAQSDIHAIIEIALDLWQNVLQKADDCERLQIEKDELEVQKKAYEMTIRALEDRVSANAALWENKFKDALDELDETEQKLLASKKPQKLRSDGTGIIDEALTGENMYDCYLEALVSIQNLKTEKAKLKRALAEATAQIELLTDNLQSLEEFTTKYEGLQGKYATISSRLAESEKANQDLLQDLDENEARIQTLQETVTEYHKKLEEMTRHLNNQRDLQLGDDINSDQHLGTCLFNELMIHQEGQSEALPLEPIAENLEPRELGVVCTSPIVIVKELTQLKKSQYLPIEKPPTTVILSRESNPAAQVNIPSEINEVATAISQTTDNIRGVDIQRIGNQIHVHLHQHSHDHSHSHLHNHDHYYSDIRNRTQPTPSNSMSADNNDASVITSPLKKPIVWSEVRLGQNKKDPWGRSNLHCKEAELNDNSKKSKFVNLSSGRDAKGIIFASTKVKARSSNSDKENETKDCKEPSVEGEVRNFATLFMNNITSQTVQAE